MKKITLNSNGFSHIESFIAILVIAVIAVVGAHVILASHAATPPPASTISNGTVKPNPNINCSYRDDTWNGGDGYTITDLSSKNGNPASFSVKMNADKGNTAVNGYPDVQCIMYSAIPKSEASAYNVTPPASSKGLDYEFAYDIWLTTAAKAKAYNWSGDQELMIWTYTVGAQRIPVGSYTGKNLSNGAQIWYGPTSSNKTVTVIEPTNSTSGSVNIYHIVNQLQTDGYVPTTNNGQLDMEYGIEAPYGGGNTFTVNSVSDGTT